MGIPLCEKRCRASPPALGLSQLLVMSPFSTHTYTHPFEVVFRMLRSVIYQNDSRTTTLLDLPASIQNAQHLRTGGSGTGGYNFLSTHPPEQPYPSIEPKGLKRTKLLENIPPAEQEYHHETQALISESLRDIRSALGQRRWLLPRQLSTSPLQDIRQVSLELNPNEPCSRPPIILSPISNIFPSIQCISDCVVSNPSSRYTSLVAGGYVHHIPPRSNFILSDVRRSSSLLSLSSSSSTVLSRWFDFILMDPPWQNRSVKNANSYKTSEDQEGDPFLRVLPIVGSQVKADGFVGIWVTNKASIRQLVLSALWENGFQLHEEWVWMKVTINGEPVTPLDGIWRRPYEVLLLFRRRGSPHANLTSASCIPDVSIWNINVQRRICVAVPDYHSRKPCLKEFIEPLLADADDYRALEVFARNLTAGWVSWGDEVLKFNYERYCAEMTKEEI